MSTPTLGLITTYREAEKSLSTPDRRVVLVGQAKYPRPCSNCGRGIYKGGTIFNYGEVQDRWVWVCLNCAPADPYKTLQLKNLRCQDCDCLLTLNESGGSYCGNCAFWEEGCSAGRLISCDEVSCCGACEECGAGANCEGCAEEEGVEVCCGSCERCEEGPINPEDYCGYCEIQFAIARMCESDDSQQLRQAGEKVRQLEEELKRAKETYDFYANHLKQQHG
jgi:hypothetical protein